MARVELKDRRFIGAQLEKKRRGWNNQEFSWKIFRKFGPSSEKYYDQFQRGGQDMSWCHVQIMAAKLGVSIEYLKNGEQVCGCGKGHTKPKFVTQAQALADIKQASEYSAGLNRKSGGPVEKYIAMMRLLTIDWSTDVDLPAGRQYKKKQGTRKHNERQRRRSRWSG